MLFNVTTYSYFFKKFVRKRSLFNKNYKCFNNRPFSYFNMSLPANDSSEFKHIAIVKVIIFIIKNTFIDLSLL